MKPLRMILALFALAAGAALLPAPAASQGSPESGDDLQALVTDLRGELDRAEKERLADPWFIRDVRKLLDRYDFPWQTRILYDDFSGQGPGPDAPWRATAGEFLIDWRHGLRSVITPASQRQAAQQQQGSTRNLIGALLQQAITGQQESQQVAAPQNPEFAAMLAPVRISNAFAIEIALSARAVGGSTAGRFEFGPYQGTAANAGYRLAYAPGAGAGAPSLELLRISPRRTSTLEFYDKPLNLHDGQEHVLTWTRDRAGAMSILLDGQELMQATDRGFRDPFDGLAVVNGGGDYALRRVVIDGTE